MSASEKYYRITSHFGGPAWMENIPEGEILRKNKGKKSRFISTYYYNKEHYKKFQETKSVAGITDVKTNKLWFDFDSDNLEESQSDAQLLVKRLIGLGNNPQIFYSGRKGFHVYIHLNQELNRKQVEKAVLYFAQGLKTFDPSMYDWNQILRIPNTQHEKTGLYNVQITNAELELPIVEIQALAKAPRHIDAPIIDSLSIELLTVKEEPKPELKLVVLDEEDPLRIKEIDFSQKPNGWRDYKWSISQGRFETGKRNFAMMVIASTCRALKYGKPHAEAICLAADKLHCEITGDEPISDKALHVEVLNTVFSSRWNGGQYSVENNVELQEYCKKHGFQQEREQPADVMSLEGVHSGFKEYVKNINQNTIKTGIRQLDEAIPITIGLNLGVLGAASSGKTALALEVLKHTSMSGVVSVIASLDMHRNRLYEKVLYKVSNEVYGRPLSKTELYDEFHNNSDSKLVDEIKKQFGNVYFYDRSSPTVQDLRNFIFEVEKFTGQKVKLLMIDYFERIGTSIQDATAASMKVANELQDLLNDLNLAIITLVQPNKFSLAGGPDSPILNYTAIKGSSFLYQSFRAIVSIWRPCFTPLTKHLDNYLEMAILKNDLGELDHFYFNWNGKIGAITEMSEEDMSGYHQALNEKRDILKPDNGEDNNVSPYGRFRK